MKVGGPEIVVATPGMRDVVIMIMVVMPVIVAMVVVVVLQELRAREVHREPDEGHRDHLSERDGHG